MEARRKNAEIGRARLQQQQQQQQQQGCVTGKAPRKAPRKTVPSKKSKGKTGLGTGNAGGVKKPHRYKPGSKSTSNPNV
jgi:hypothetical protein